MSTVPNGQAMTQSPAAALTNLGLSPKSLMSSISQMNRMSLDDLPPLTLPPSYNHLPSRSLIAFSLFSELPAELRLKIWHHACFVGRDIDLRVDFLGSLWKVPTDRHGDLSWMPYKFWTNKPRPPILLACKESRTVALTHYRLSFGTFFNLKNVRVSTPSTIYVNWQCDRICLAIWPTKNHGLPTDMSPVETLIKICLENELRRIAFNVWQNKHWPYVNFITKIPSIREVLLFGSDEVTPGLGLRWGFSFIKLNVFAAEYPGSWKIGKTQNWVSRLEAHRKDLATFFELNRCRAPEDAANMEPIELWQPPRIELGWTIIKGNPDISEWDW